MLKKILLGTLFVGLIGILVTGAVVRTIDRTELVAEAQGRGRGNGETGTYTAEGSGQENARNSVAQRQYPNNETSPQEWLESEGIVVQAPADGVDLVIQTSDGQEVKVGTGPEYMASQGFTLQAGDPVQVRGYWEDGELKAAQVTRLADGQTITLRDEAGHPAWAGNGKRAVERQATAAQGGRGQGGYGGRGREDAPGAQTGNGQAGENEKEWLTFQGTVASVDANTLVVETASGQQVIVENRAWWFVQEQGFSTQEGDQVTLTGFYENDDPSTGSGFHFEVGQIDNITTGQTVLVRDENGRPLWAGQGRGNGGRGRRSA